MGADDGVDRGGAAEPNQIHHRSGDHDDRSRLTRRLHDAPQQACPFFFLLLQTDVGVLFSIFFFSPVKNP